MLWILAGIIAIIFLIGCSAFFSGSEMAFVSVSRASIRDKANRGNRQAQTLEKLLDTPDEVVSAIVVGNNIVNIFASVIAGSIATAVFGDIGIGIATAVMTLLIVIFSEVTPKAFGINNEKMALRISRALKIITRIFYPVSVFLTAVSNKIIGLTPGREKRSTAVTEEEIRAMLELGEEEGTIKGDEKEMVNEILDFDDTIAWGVHVPRNDIVFLHEDDSIADLVKTSIETGYSRFPVYRDTIDDIVGLVHVKDTLDVDDMDRPLNAMLRDILKIRAGMKADDVLREMQRRKTHLAILQGKDGDTLGLITLEDLIEEVFGEIADEHDTL
ncbi:MAG: HlyC/CorC family transporter [Candidatus Thermoplasmatota archaeon]|nr:HlyC/CorC family transporter [Candidatus Thermoplasmatota archaeon]